MLTITPIYQNYYNRNVSFKAKPQETNSKPETPKEYSYADLYAKMRELEITGVEEQEVIPIPKEAIDSQKAESEDLETLPLNILGMTELHSICMHGNLEEFNNFIKKHPNFDPNQRDNADGSYISTALYYQRGRNLDIVNLLAANKNLDLNKTDQDGWDDLHTLCCYGRLNAIKIFVENHPDFNPFKRTNSGSSYIGIAQTYEHHNVTDYWIRYFNQKYPKISLYGL